MAKTAQPFSKPRVKRAPMTSTYQAQAAAPAVRDRTAEQLRAAQLQLSQIKTTWSMLRPLIPADLRARRPFTAHDLAIRRRSLPLRGLGAIDTMSPTLWGLLGLTVGVGATWAWLTLR